MESSQGSPMGKGRQVNVTEPHLEDSPPTFAPRRIADGVITSLIEEASPEKPFLIPKPLMRKMEFDYDLPGGCEVRLELKSGNFYHGTIFVNPQSETNDKTMLKLIKVTKVAPVTYEAISAMISGILEFTSSEIQKVYVLKYQKPSAKRMGEMMLNTFVVKTIAQFKNLMVALTGGGDNSEVAFKLFGVNKGRFMELHWIVLCTRQTLISIHMQEELNTELVWTELKEKLFENPKILKIVHDVRFEADYLFHAVLSGIRLRNVFDTQLGVYFMDLRKRAVTKRKFVKENPKAKVRHEPEVLLSKLSLALARFLGNVVWERELNLLYKFETDNWCKVPYFAEKPLPPSDALKYMALSVKYLHLLRNELMSDMMLCYTLCCKKMMRHMYTANVGDVVRILEEPVQLPKPLYEEVRDLSTSLNLETPREIQPGNRSFMTNSSERLPSNGRGQV